MYKIGLSKISIRKIRKW